MSTQVTRTHRVPKWPVTPAECKLQCRVPEHVTLTVLDNGAQVRSSEAAIVLHMHSAGLRSAARREAVQCVQAEYGAARRLLACALGVDVVVGALCLHPRASGGAAASFVENASLEAHLLHWLHELAQVYDARVERKVRCGARGRGRGRAD